MRKLLTCIVLAFSMALPVLAADTPSATPLRDSAERVVASSALTQEDKLFAATGLDRHNKPKSFWSTTNLLIGVGQGLALTADLETTIPNLGSKTTTRTLVEANRWMHPMVHEGRPAAYGAKVAVNGAILVGSHFMRQSKHKGLRTLGAVLPVVSIGGQFGLAVHNNNLARQLK